METPPTLTASPPHRRRGVLHGGLREDPLERVVGAGHRDHHRRAGGAALRHGLHGQHLGVLRLLRALQRLLPVPGSHRHVSASVPAVPAPTRRRRSSEGLCCAARFQIASSLTKELCALVFGINTFLGTILTSIINLIFSDKKGLGLDVHAQVTHTHTHQL